MFSGEEGRLSLLSPVFQLEHLYTHTLTGVNGMRTSLFYFSLFLLLFNQTVLFALTIRCLDLLLSR